MYSKDFTIQFTDLDGVPHEATVALGRNVVAISKIDYAEASFGIGVGSTDVKFYDSVGALKGLDFLVAEGAFNVVIHLMDKHHNVKVVRTLQGCGIRKTVFQSLLAHSCNDVMGTSFGIMFNTYTNTYPDTE